MDKKVHKGFMNRIACFLTSLLLLGKRAQGGLVAAFIGILVAVIVGVGVAN